MARRAPLAVFILLLGLVYATIGRDLRNPNNGNIWSRSALLFSIVERHSLDIDPYLSRTDDWARSGGHYYTNKAPGPALLAAPAYFLQYELERALGADPNSLRARNLAVYLANLVTTVIPTLVAVALLWCLLVDRFGLGEAAAFAVCTAWAMGSLALVYGVIFFGHQTAAAFFCIGLCLSLPEVEARRRPRRLALAAAAMGLGVLCDFACVVGVAAWTVWLALRARRDWRALAAWLLGGLPFVLVLLAYDRACFGHALTTSYSIEVLNPHWVALVGLRAPDLDRLADVTVRPFRGIFYCAPVYALAFVGIDRLRRTGRRFPELWSAAAALVAFLLLESVYPTAFGGFCVGPRYMTSLLPLVTLLFVPVVELVPVLFGVLTALSSVLMLEAALTDPLPNQAWRDPYHDRIIPLLTANASSGQVSLLHDGLHASQLASLCGYLALVGAFWLWIAYRHRARP